MTYTRTTPQPDGLSAGEIAVTLDSGHTVAITVTGEVQPGTGKHVVVVRARHLDAPMSEPVEYRHTVDPLQLASIDAIRKECVRQVLGEAPSPEWADSIHAARIADVNIRHRISAAAHTGSVDASTLV